MAPLVEGWPLPHLYTSPWQNALLDRVALLPPEIIQLIIQQMFLVHGCIIQRLAPRFSRSMVDGRVSARMRYEDLQRIEVYTRGGPRQRGEYRVLTHQIDVEASFFCRDDAPDWYDQENPGIAAVSRRWPREFQYACAAVLKEAVHVFDDALHRLPRSDNVQPRLPMDDNHIQGYSMCVESVSTAWWRAFYILPCKGPDNKDKRAATSSVDSDPLQSSIRHLALGSTIRGSGDPSRLAWEWWLGIDWARFPRLKTLFMDLSFIGNIAADRDLDPNDMTEDLVSIMSGDVDHFNATGDLRIRGMDALNLNLLVIRGLKSGRSYPPSRDMDLLRRGSPNYRVPLDFSAAQVEDSNRLEHLGVTFTNWVRCFRPALAPGGRLVLLDEREVPDWMG